MPYYTFNNVNTAFRCLLEEVTTNNIGLRRLLFSTTSSRNGGVIRWRRPVTIEYQNPLQRVIFNQARDCSPFFHLYEALWMLAGRNDLAPLQYYVSDFGQYSDDGVTLNGAYGHRWRHASTGDNEFEDVCSEHYHCCDQLKIIIDHLKKQSGSRRAVLHISNVEDDTLKMDTTKDQACNLCCVFEIEQTPVPLPISEINIGGDPGWNEPREYKSKLNMTVYNRSNDLIYGALGANVVHFSFLMEYLAACIGVEVGTYCQISSNMHVYLDPKKWKPEKWLAEPACDWYTARPGELAVRPFPLVKDPGTFDEEVIRFVELHKETANDVGDWKEPFLRDVARPMLLAFHWHKKRYYVTALDALEMCQAADWKIAGRNWILKRQRNWEAKNLKPHYTSEIDPEHYM